MTIARLAGRSKDLPMPTPSAQTDAARRELLAELAREIDYHEKAYRSGAPEIPDSAFDELFEQYQELATELGIPEEERLDRKPGSDHAEGFEEVTHAVPMLSLEKLSSARKDSKGESVSLGEQLENWVSRRRQDLELAAEAPLKLIVEPVLLVKQAPIVGLRLPERSPPKARSAFPAAPKLYVLPALLEPVPAE